ncbi:MAG TPA: sulfite exporter TauE/SafE family protein [Gemmatimonadales bacterium]|nr:sulfite exporter TauE/SafE family protein [Gemmatimonadales bacterium]
MPHAIRLFLVVLAAFLAGAVNSVAGGGTLLSFPALVGLGVPPIIANATSTVALWPASVGSLWGYRAELAGTRRWALRFAVPSAAGGALGAWLLLVTPPRVFDGVVPVLVLGATMLFVMQRPLQRFTGRPAAEGVDRSTELPAFTLPLAAWQLGVGVYGGYFGAGIGILMLAALGLMGFTNIHRMNGLKNWGGLCINAVAAGIFAFSRLVSWPVALAMAAGSAAGGYFGAGLAQRVGQRPVRAGVVVIGFASAVWLFLARP